MLGETSKRALTGLVDVSPAFYSFEYMQGIVRINNHSGTFREAARRNHRYIASVTGLKTYHVRLLRIM